MSSQFIFSKCLNMRIILSVRVPGCAIEKIIFCPLNSTFINSFFPSAPFLYPLKTENRKVF